MKPKFRSPIGFALLAVLAAAGSPALAADPAPVSLPRQVDRLPADDRRCGTAEAPLRVRNRDGRRVDDTYYCTTAIERTPANGPSVETAIVRESEVCGESLLVCGEDGGGVVASRIWSQDPTVWILQNFTAAGTLAGPLRRIESHPECRGGWPDAWHLDASGDLLAVEACPDADWQARVALRRFPAVEGPEPLPLWVRGVTGRNVYGVGFDFDDLGNAIVGWSEVLAVDEQHQHFSAILARGLGPDREPAGEPFRLDTFGGEFSRVGLAAVHAESDGLFDVYWHSTAEGAVMVRGVSLDPEAFPAGGATTTTTLPPSAAMPSFDRISFVGASEPPAEGAPLEGPLASMNGSTDGLLMLRRWVSGSSGYDDAIPATSTYLSGNGGVRWRRSDQAPPVYRYQDSPPWEAAAPGGTLVAAELAWRYVGTDDYYDRQMNLVSRRSEDGGETWSDATAIADIHCGDCDEFLFHEVALAGDGSGAWVVAWVSSDRISNGDPEVYGTTIETAFSFDDGRTWSAGRQVWSDAIAVECCGISDHVRHSLTAVSGTDASWGLAWRSEKKGTLWTARAADASSPWEVHQVVAPVSPPPGVELWDWYDYASPYGRPAFVATPSGARVLAWEEGHAPEAYGPDGDIFYVRSGDDGRTWSGPAALGAYARIDASVDRDPSLAADAAGRLLAVWSSHDSLGGSIGTDSDIVASVSLDGGLTWSPPAPLDPAATDDDRHDFNPMAAATGDGRWAVAWTTLPLWRWIWEFQDATVKVAVAGSACGNGLLETGEECDDGNLVDLDGCHASCTLPGCRNGVVDAGEVCDYDDPETGPSCTEECEPSVCGDGTRNVWTEQCDDGNDEDDDECPTTCRRPYCGDGFVYGPWEQCDDANTTDTDACRNGCDLAYCGDGVLREGVEVCDDGDGWGGNACTDRCLPAVCGDGRVQLGVEECDDPDGRLHQGACTEDCRYSERCGDADANGSTTATDALRILRNAIELGDICTPERCDVNGSERVTAVDASGALRTAAGIGVELLCPTTGTASLVLEASPPLGALQFEVDFSGTNMGFGWGDSRSGCELRAPDTLFADYVSPEGRLVLGFLSLRGIRGPVELVRCVVYARRDATPDEGALKITLAEATGVDGSAVEPPPVIRLVTN